MNSEKIISNMSLKDKIGQLFIYLVTEMNLENIKKDFQDSQPGGIMLRPSSSVDVKNFLEKIKEKFKIIPFISSNMESGPNGICTDYPFLGNHLQLGNISDKNISMEYGRISALYAKNAGANMTFSPIVDIQWNPENPMTGTRSFSKDYKKVIFNAKNVLEGYKKENFVGCIKHFPGDGTSNLDHHLSIATNFLNFEKWNETYGTVYKELINYGVEMIMVGHIAFPEYLKFRNAENIYEPASTSKEVITDLLRNELGYNGLIITDSTLMAGYTSYTTRKEAIIKSLKSGVDMILFSRSFKEDLQYVKEAVEEKYLSVEEIDEKLKRILSLKNKILNEEHKNIEDNTLLEGRVKNLKKEISERSIEIKKLENGLLPLKKKSKVLLHYLYRTKNSNVDFIEILSEKLRNNEIEIFTRDYKNNSKLAQEDMKLSCEEFKEKYDLVIYVLNYQILSNFQNIRHEYNAANGIDAPWFIREIPTIFVSLSNPNHYKDLIMAQNYININSDDEESLNVLVKLLLEGEKNAKKFFD